ncbi:MAG: PRC-barrel domain-containing protein [Synechococcales cyanobacterium K44_A2020_017]|nr:PRC-barrel domain-containing protein [Synechococcales cyanobacterium K32_A2020_035]MBF2096692.1 PRC-barrel domain-containing protein [Synechococcales cyanobacterium K44_A2020_017]
MPTSKPKLIHQSIVLHRPILHRDTTEELGRVEVVWMYPDAHRVLGFVSKQGLVSSKRLAFTLNQIHTLGPESIVVTASPTETEAQKVRQLETLLGLEVWSESGSKLGKIVDYAFDIKTGAIAYYLFTSDGWLGFAQGLYRLPPRYLLSSGRQRVLVAEAASRKLTVEREGIQERLTHIRDRLRKNYSDATDELQDWTTQAQTTAQQVTGRVRQWSSQWGSQAKQWTETLRQRAQVQVEDTRHQAQTWNERLRDEGQTFTQQAKETGRSLLDRVKQQAALLTDRIEEFDFFHVPDEFESDRPLTPDHDGDEDEFEILFDDWSAEEDAKGDRSERPGANPEKTPAAGSALTKQASGALSTEDQRPIQPDLIPGPDLEDDDPWI